MDDTFIKGIDQMPPTFYMREQKPFKISIYCCQCATIKSVALTPTVFSSDDNGDNKWM